MSEESPSTARSIRREATAFLQWDSETTPTSLTTPRGASSHTIRIFVLLFVLVHLSTLLGARSLINWSLVIQSLCVGERYNFIDFDGVGGFLVQRLKPANAGSKFTTHAFSSDGAFMATGETDGTVRIWDTVDYKLKRQAHGLFAESIHCLSFIDDSNADLIAVDASGRVLEFSFKDIEEGRSSKNDNVVRIIREKKTKKLINAHESNDGISYQLSEDGRLLLCGRCTPSHPILLYHFRDTIKSQSIDVRDATSIQDCQWSVPVLSKNRTSSLLVLLSGRSLGMFETVVYPSIFLGSLEAVRFSGARGIWARKGEYLMLWRNEFSDRPMLEIRMTQRLDERSRRVRRHLERGLAKWNAQMVDSEDVYVAIHTISQTGCHRIQMWAVSTDFIVSEVILDMRPNRQVDTAMWAMGSAPISKIVDSASSFSSREDIFGRFLEDYHTKFCISKDRSMAVTFSWSLHACTVCSLSSSATLWSFAIPEDVIFDPLQMQNDVMFDPSGNRFLLLGNAAIFVADASTRVDLRLRIYEELQYFPKKHVKVSSSLMHAFVDLPSESLAIIASAQRANKCWSTIHGQPLRIDDVKDVAIARDQTRMAMIVRIEKETVVVFGDIHDFSLVHQHGEGWKVDVSCNFEASMGFCPKRVFLSVDDQGNDIMVVLSVAQAVQATFHNLNDRKRTVVVDIELQKIHTVTQTQDGQRLVMLGDREVCIMDLRRRRIVKSIGYKVNFESIAKTKRNHMEWMPHRSSKRNGMSEGHICDNGDTVLLAWDVKNERSIILTPSTTQNQCEAMIYAAEESLSACCLLSHNGRVTLFIDIDALQHGRLTVGVFNESIKRVTHRVRVQDLQNSVDVDGIAHILANVFYNLTADGSKLVTVTTPSCSSLAPPLNHCVRIFSVHNSEACLTGYDRLVLRAGFDARISPKEWVFLSLTKRMVYADRLFERFGPSVFNVPVNGQTSLFQKAILHRLWDVVESIQEIALRNKIFLSLDCPQTTNHSESNSLFRSLFTSESTNDIRKALALVCSETTSFDQAAETMSTAFKILSFKHRHIMQEILSKKELKSRVCELDVHVNFMDAKLRRDKAIHIGTIETYHEWTNTEDPVVLGESWRDKNIETVEEMEKNGNLSTSKAVMVVVCIKDAAKVGMQGIIRLLLMQNAPAHIFNLDVVKWVIMYKWMKIWRPRSIKQAAIYVCFLGTYTAYALILGSSAEIYHESVRKKSSLTAVLIVVIIFGCQMLREEIKQAKTFVKEGLKQNKGWTWGLRYHFVSRWNWVDLFSCLMLIVMLPLFHCLVISGFGFEKSLSAVVAIEAIVAALKMWYFAQPFRETGAMVLMVNKVFRECIAFLSLTFLILFGFSLALHVLFRHEASRDSTMEGGQASNEQVSLSFKNFQRSLVTLFYAVLGTFEPEVFWSAGGLVWLVVIIFIMFLVTETFVMFNLVIAIMGDAFDKVKSTEDDQLLKGRANFIDSREAAMSEKEIEDLNKKVGRYICVLMAPTEESDTEPDRKWRGRMLTQEAHFKAAIKQSERNLQELMEQQMIAIHKSIGVQDNKILEISTQLRTMQETLKEHFDSQIVLRRRMEGMEAKMELLFEEQARAQGSKETSPRNDNQSPVMMQLANTVASSAGQLKDLETKIEGMNMMISGMNERNADQFQSIMTLLEERSST